MLPTLALTRHWPQSRKAVLTITVMMQLNGAADMNAAMHDGTKRAPT